MYITPGKWSLKYILPTDDPGGVCVCVWSESEISEATIINDCPIILPGAGLPVPFADPFPLRDMCVRVCVGNVFMGFWVVRVRVEFEYSQAHTQLQEPDGRRADGFPTDATLGRRKSSAGSCRHAAEHQGP